MTIKMKNSSRHCLLFDPHKTEINNLIFKELNYHYRKSAPINSSKTIKPTKSNLDSELEKARIYMSPIKTHSKTLSLELNLGRKTVEPQNRRSLDPKSSPDTFHYLTQTRSDFYRKQETFSHESQKILEKFTPLFTKTVPKSSLKISEIKIRAPSIFKTQTDKSLHQEYINDRKHFSSIHLNGRKKLWRPDCSKILRKVDKIISSIPKLKLK